MQVIPPGPLRTQRSHVFLGGNFPLFADDWAVATLTPEPEDGDFLAAAATIGLHLHDLGIQVRSTSRSSMGTTLIRFSTVTDRDAAVVGSPYFLGESVIMFVNGINKHSSVMTHDVRCMLLNYPQQLWDPETVMRTFNQFGRFLVWKDCSNRARVLVKFRAHNVDTLPLSVVVGKNLSDDGQTDTWTCPMILLSTTMLGGHAGDEDPLPPNGENPYPMPLIHAGFWHDANMEPQMDDMADVGDNIQEEPADGHHAAPAPMAAPVAANGILSPQHPLFTENFIPVPEPEQEPDAITQLTKLIKKLMENEVEHELINKLVGNQINGTTINLEET
jgi:hypothetical protein